MLSIRMILLEKNALTFKRKKLLLSIPTQIFTLFI